MIPRDYPEVSTKVADRTTLGSLQFTELCAMLHINPLPGWCVEPDKNKVATLVHGYSEVCLLIDHYRSLKGKQISQRRKTSSQKSSMTTHQG